MVRFGVSSGTGDKDGYSHTHLQSLAQGPGPLEHNGNGSWEDRACAGRFHAVSPKTVPNVRTKYYDAGICCRPAA